MDPILPKHGASRKPGAVQYRFINLFCPRYTEGLLPRAASAYVRLELHVDVQLRRVSLCRLTPELT